MYGLTQKRIKFCQAYIENGNASEAYRAVYSSENMLPESIHKEASRILAAPNVTQYVGELQAQHAKKHAVTIESLTKELEEARAMAAQTENASAMTGATMGKAKIHGHDVTKVENSGSFSINVVTGVPRGD